MNECHKEALKLLEAGQSVIPIGSDKKPALSSWREYQQRLPTREELAGWFAQPAGVGRVCGAISGNVEVIDFDVNPEMEIGDLEGVYDAWKSIVDDLAPGLVDRLKRITTPRPGRHVSYRCPSVPAGSQKLAQVQVGNQWAAFIETRGEGGYTLMPGSPKWTHGKAGTYVHEAGPEVEPLITEDERRILLQAARALTLKTEEQPQPEQSPARRVEGAVLPGDDFNANGTWAEVFPHGWELVYSKNGEERWKRPGGSSRWSVVCNHAGSGMLVAFSTGCNLETERGYSRFSAFCQLQCGGDPVEASRRLRERGYGTDTAGAADVVDVSLIIGKGAGIGQPRREEQAAPILTTQAPGIIAGMIDYTLATSHILQPNLALAGALSFLGALVGRKVRDQYGTRPNILTISLSGTATGKEAARETNRQISRAAGCPELLGPEGIASSAGLLNAMESRLSLLFQIDEIGRFLKGGDGRNPMKYEVITTLMKLFTASASEYTTDAYKDIERTKTIPHPNCNLYGVSVPEWFLAGLTAENIIDGFYGRLLIFEGSKPERQKPAAIEVPEWLVQRVEEWHKFTPGGNLCSVSGAESLVIPIDDNAEALIDDFMDETHSIIDSATDDNQRAVWGRAIEKTRKLCLLHACSEFSPAEVRVTVDAAEWAVETIRALTERAMVLSEQIAENDTAKHSNKLVKIIRDAGMITGAELCRQTRGMKPHERKALIDELVRNGEVEQATEKGRGRPRFLYVWTGE